MSDNEVQTHGAHLSDSLTNQHREDDGDGEGPIQLATDSTEQGETTQQQYVSDQRMDQSEHTSETVVCGEDEQHETVASVKEPVSTESIMTTQQQCVSDTRTDQSERTSETVVCSQDERHETVTGIEATDSVPPCTLELIHDQSLDRSTVGAAPQEQPLLSSIVTGIGDQESHNFSAPTLPTEYVQSPLSENPPGSEQGLGSNQHPRELQTFVGQTTSSPELMSLPSSPEVVQIEETNESDSGRSSPYLFLHKHTMADASKFESAGLLYARATVDRHNRDLMRPADEVAEDVLEALGEEEMQVGRGEDGGEERDSDKGERTKESEKHQEEDSESLEEAPSLRRLKRHTTPIDPGVLVEIERQAQTVAAELSYVMDNLRNSLHAMSVCAKQTVELHRESVDNLHQVVDANVKAMYIFMAKFEELNKCLAPVQQIAVQIREINESLRILERSFRIS